MGRGLAEARYRASLKVLHGPGGAGKTRTAVEVAHALMRDGWEAFFLPSQTLRQVAVPHGDLRSQARAWLPSPPIPWPTTSSPDGTT